MGIRKEPLSRVCAVEGEESMCMIHAGMCICISTNRRWPAWRCSRYRSRRADWSSAVPWLPNVIEAYAASLLVPLKDQEQKRSKDKSWGRNRHSVYIINRSIAICPRLSQDTRWIHRVCVCVCVCVCLKRYTWMCVQLTRKRSIRDVTRNRLIARGKLYVWMGPLKINNTGTK